jgi:hypothetical protein
MAVFATAIMTAFSAAASTAATAASTVGSTVASAAGAAGSGGGFLSSIGSMFSSNAGTLLSGGLGLVSAMASGRQSEMQAAALRAQGEDARFDARSEEINAMQRQTSLRRNLLKLVGESDVAYAASGVDLSFGTAVTAREDAIEDGNRAVMADQDAAAMKIARGRAKAANYDAMASETEAAGKFKMAGALLQPLVSAARRG